MKTISNLENFNPIGNKGKDFLEFLKSVALSNDFFDAPERKELKKTLWKNRPSENSLSFCRAIEDVFDIKDKTTFFIKYRQAASGDGSEGTRMKVLHSSSRLALLVFQGVSEKTPLKMRLKDELDAVFTESYFEIQNPLKGSDRPSNIDVVLCGHAENDSTRKVTLFLESKFSEYLTNGKETGISKEVYEMIYSDIFTNERKWGLQFEVSEDGTLTLFSKPKTNHYCAGIKQMISHYLGATNAILQGWNLLERKKHELDSGTEYFLGEILFDFGDNIKDAAKKMDDYSALYKELAGVLNNLSDRDGANLTIVSQDFTYQDILKNNPEFNPGEYVKRFYGF